jgi:RNA polymerase sigma factor (sigma-70 family)
MVRGCGVYQQDFSELSGGMRRARWLRAWGSRALLLRVARRHGVSREDAEDVVQEAVLRAVEHPEIPDEQLRAWLVVVTTRLCLDEHRRRVREVKRWERQSAHAMVQQPGQYLEDEVCDRSEADWVTSLAAELLPSRQAQALRLAAAGCDVQQVASQLGVRYRAAESLVARGRRTLRTAVSAGLGACRSGCGRRTCAGTSPGDR